MKKTPNSRSLYEALSLDCFIMTLPDPIVQRMTPMNDAEWLILETTDKDLRKKDR